MRCPRTDWAKNNGCRAIVVLCVLYFFFQDAHFLFFIKVILLIYVAVPYMMMKMASMIRRNGNKCTISEDNGPIL